MPITEFLSCTHVFGEFESLSPVQRHHAKTYATGLVAGSNKTVAGIAREVLPANSKRALNNFLTEYDWDEQQFNHERLEELMNRLLVRSVATRIMPTCSVYRKTAPMLNELYSKFSCLSR